MDFNWDDLDLGVCDLTGLDDLFTEEEMHNAINQMPSNKALDPDGFTGAFFKKCWYIIRVDITGP